MDSSTWPSFTPTVRQGDNGFHVYAVQQLLALRGYGGGGVREADRQNMLTAVLGGARGEHKGSWESCPCGTVLLVN